jgi:predicted transcriptional regulator
VAVAVLAEIGWIENHEEKKRKKGKKEKKKG